MLLARRALLLRRGLHTQLRALRRAMATSDAALPPTQLLYFDDTFALGHTAKVLRVVDASGDAAPCVVVDATVFYPAGGGQPADKGFLLRGASDGNDDDGDDGGDASSRVAVTDVRLRDGVVHHFLDAPAGSALPPWLFPGAPVRLRVDGPTRVLHARVHSAGHLLDVCMARCGYDATALVPTKGQHTPGDAYVEYAGKVPPEDQEPLILRLNAALAAAVAAGGPVTAGVHDYKRAAALCGGSLPSYIAAGSTPRVVAMGDAPGCPCGGTHVADIQQVGGVTVTGVRVKKGVTRIMYVVSAA